MILGLKKLNFYINLVYICPNSRVFYCTGHHGVKKCYVCVTNDNVLKNIQIKTCYGWDIGIAIDTADSKVRLFDINISAKSKAYCIRKCCSMTIRDTGGTWVILIKKKLAAS